MAELDPFPGLEGLQLRADTVEANGVRLYYVEGGPADGPPVLLLHGFPEMWAGWRHQIPALIDAGFRVVALDARGYDRSDTPRGVAAYDLDVLAADVLAVAQRLRLAPLRIVGHDWGAAVVWWLTTTQPRQLHKVAVINAGHPTLWRRAMRRDPRQRRKSWYVYALALPWLPELLMRANDFNALAQSLTASSRAGTFSAAELAAYRRAWARPGALTAMINWYRALLRKRMPASLPAIDVELLLVWGVEDQFGERSVADESLRLCRRGRGEFIAGATHWVHHEEPARVNELLIDFLGD